MHVSGTLPSTDSLPETLAQFYGEINNSELVQTSHSRLKCLMDLLVRQIGAEVHQNIKLLNIYSYSLFNCRVILLSQANNCKGSTLFSLQEYSSISQPANWVVFVILCQMSESKYLLIYSQDICSTWPGKRIAGS
jgi:hypothetical protein